MSRAAPHPYVFLILTAAFWAGNAVVGKLSVGHVSPMLLTCLRWTLAVVLLLPFAWPRLRGDWPVVRAHLAYLFVMGACGMTLFNALLYVALHHTSAVQVTIMQSAMPLVVFLGMFLFFAKRVLAVQILGFSLTAVGVALTAARGDLSALLSLQLNRGDAMMLGAVLLYGGFTVALGFKPRLHWLTLILVLAVAAWLTSLPLVGIEVARGQVLAPSATGWMAVVYTALFASIVAQLFYIRGVELIGAARANLFINLVPIFGAGMAVVFLNEALYPYHFVALALVVGGILLAERARFANEAE